MDTRAAEFKQRKQKSKADTITNLTLQKRIYICVCVFDFDKLLQDYITHLYLLGVSQYLLNADLDLRLSISLWHQA